MINSSYYLEVNLLLVCHLRLFWFCFLFVVAAVLANKDVYFAHRCIATEDNTAGIYKTDLLQNY